MDSEGWRVSLSRDWDVLGPFPIHAREQHFLSPSFPLDLTVPIDPNATYPSSYADGGLVGWTKAQSQEDGNLQISFPDIRWESLRTTEGWAALQHHSVLRSTVTVYPPPQLTSAPASVPRLLVKLIQGSFFTVLPSQRQNSSVPIWHAGNIYALGRSPPNAVSLPAPPSSDQPTTYDIFVSGDYEIRLFGDPRGDLPKLSITLTVDIEEPEHAIVRDSTHDVSCDFVDGWAFGDAVGIGLLSVDGWWIVKDVAPAHDLRGYAQLELLQETRIAPGQRRIVPIKLTQTQPIDTDKLRFTLSIVSAESQTSIDVVIPVRNKPNWSLVDGESDSIQASYFFATSTPTAFVVAPPNKPNADAILPPILALHGAGVEILEHDFWIRAIPRQEHSWIITPTGRTAWGMDWHGPSAQDAWGTVDALYRILDVREEWKQWRTAPETKVLLMGHSNGGQGAWYLAARYPDRVVAVVPAAGYIKSQSYVSWVQSRSAHYVDPALRAILDSSLTPDDNDLFLSNLADTPVLAIHGGDDENVPVWHTREAVSVLKTWNPLANVTYREDPGEPHWYQSLFASEQVKSFVSSSLAKSTSDGAAATQSFTLTVSVPSDSGSLHGWSIHTLTIPGRLGRLAVDISGGAIRARTKNVKAFSIRLGSVPVGARGNSFILDGQVIELDEGTWDLSDFSLAVSQDNGRWTPYAHGVISRGSPSGRIANILNSGGPLTIVVPTHEPSSELSAALRLAHNLNVYHKLDAEIINDEEALGKLGEASFSLVNVVVIGLGKFARSVLLQGKTVFRVQGDTLELRGRPLNDPSLATLFLHPHPSSTTSSLLFIHGNDVAGLERGLRSFPIRTGITVPDWIVVGSQADKYGSGGVEGAGVWGNDWSWNEAMSAF
ncbi:hypothetical protein C8Q78DRAFT_1070204 [Trametes maxima]|nr:hypothetical protein C8Q78DRAFT_1070204 [Trametes maxima]